LNDSNMAIDERITAYTAHHADQICAPYRLPDDASAVAEADEE